MGLFNKWSKADLLKNCPLPFGIVRIQTGPDGRACGLEIAHVNDAMEEYTGELAKWQDILYPAAGSLQDVKHRIYLEEQEKLVLLTAFPLEKDVCGVFLKDYTSLVDELVRSVSGQDIGVFYYQSDTDVLIADRSMQELFGCKKRYDGLLSAFAMKMIDEAYVDLLRAQLQDFPESTRMINVNLKTKSGRFVRFSLNADEDPEETLAIGYLEDISNAPTFAEQAERDTLTGLFHGISAKERIDKMIEECFETNRIDALLLLDLDGFSLVNQLQGHDGGDEMLKKIAEILKNNFKGKDIIARPGGDEFLVYVSDLNDKRSALQICRTLNRLVTQTIQEGDGEPVRITASIGVGFACDNGGNYDKLFRNVEAAMRETKANGKNGYTLA